MLNKMEASKLWKCEGGVLHAEYEKYGWKMWTQSTRGIITLFFSWSHYSSTYTYFPIIILRCHCDIFQIGLDSEKKMNK